MASRSDGLANRGKMNNKLPPVWQAETPTAETLEVRRWKFDVQRAEHRTFNVQRRTSNEGRTGQWLLGHEDAASTQIHTHALSKPGIGAQPWTESCQKLRIFARFARFARLALTLPRSVVLTMAGMCDASLTRRPNLRRVPGSEFGVPSCQNPESGTRNSMVRTLNIPTHYDKQYKSNMSSKIAPTRK
jgi:hypothetical protein